MVIRQVITSVVRRIGVVQARIVLTAVYLIGMGPLALATRWVRDPLHLRPQATGWRHRVDAMASLADARRQF